MLVYWDLTLILNGAADYLLLLSAARLAGRTVARGRLAAAALLGGVFSAAELFYPGLLWLSAAVLAAMVLLAFYGTGRALKLGFLTLLLACALGGSVLLLGRCCGSLSRAARGLPWGVLLGAMGLTYFLLSTVFRGGAARGGEDFLTVKLTHGGRSVTLRLLRDSGNLLTDPTSGASVPVIGRSALRAILPKDEAEYIALSCVTASGSGTLRAFYCESVRVRGEAPARRLVAVSDDLYGDGGFQGVWRAEKGGERCEAAQTALG